MTRILGVMGLICLTLAMMLAMAPAHAQQNDDLQQLYRDLDTLRQAGKYSDAEPLAERIVEIARTRFGESHVQYAFALNDLALVVANQHRYGAAERLFVRALAILEKASGREHPHVTTSLTGLSAVYTAKGQDAEAQQVWARALAIREKELGPNHPDVEAMRSHLEKLQKLQRQ